MTAQERFAAVAARIAVLPNVIRTRREEEVRALHAVEDFDALQAAAALKLEKVAAELEKAVA